VTREGGPGLPRRARIAALLGLGQVLGRGGVALYTLALVRLLPITEFGDFAFAVAIATIATALADGGFARLIVRDLARTDEPGALAREFLAVRAFAVGIVVALSAAACAAGLVSVEATLAAALCAYVLSEALSYGYESAAVGSERPARFAAAQWIGGLGLAAALAVLVASDSRSASDAMVGMAAASFLKLGVHVVLWRKSPARPRRLRELPARRWLRQALPFLALGVLATAYYRVGIVMLHGVRGPGETAPFAAAFRVLDAVAVLAGVVFATVSPVLSRAHHQRPEEVVRIWSRMVLRAAAVALPAAAVVAVAAHPIAGLLFGQRYGESAGDSLRWLAPGMALLVLQNITAAVVFMSDELRSVVALTLVNVCVSLPLTWLLVRASGASGAALATSIMELVSFATFAVLVRRRFGSSRYAGIPPLQSPAS
jgi:O-antigen/teichoic acid export membrane protein